MNKFNQHIFLWLVATSLILGLVAYKATDSITNLIEQNNLVSRTHQVLAKLSDTLSQMREVESTERGYLITGDKDYLVQYQQALQTIDHTLDDLLGLVVYDPQQYHRAERLSVMVHARLNQVESVRKTYEEKGMKLAFSQWREGERQKDSDQLLALMNEMERTESGLLSERHNSASYAAESAFVIGGLGLVGCISIFLFLFWTIDREGVRRSRVESSLKDVVRQMERIQYEMQQLSQLGDYLQSCRAKEEIYSLVSHHMARILPHTRGVLGIFSNSRNVIDTVARWGESEESDDKKQFLPEECWGLRRGTVHYIEHDSHDPRCAHVKNHALDSICFPMVAHGETVGMINVTSELHGYFDARAQQLLRSVAEQVSLALANMKLEETLRMQSLRDPLTQLFNRRYMESSLEREVLRAKRHKLSLAVIMLDVDHFKNFNDTFGHEAGDLLLREFAKLLQHNIRGEDIACRYGGEEFIVILPGANAENAAKRAEKLRAEVAAMEVGHLGRTLGKVTVSLGVAAFPEHCDHPNELVKLADAALYKAKHGGRDSVVVSTN